MKRNFVGILILLLYGSIQSQVVELSEVVVSAVNYKYLQGVGAADAAVAVKSLEEKVAKYDLKHSDIYDDMYETYRVSFFIPQGKVVAAYDKDGNIIRTIEKFENTRLPKESRDAIVQRFPNWTMVENIYRINYHNKKGTTRNDYQVKLVNGDQVITVKIDAEGNFM